MLSPRTNHHPAEAACTLVQLVEVWLPTEDGLALQCAERCVFADLICVSESDLQTPSHPSRCSEATVKPGEGPAGMAWHQRRAIILQESPSELLESLGQRHGFNLQAIVAIPTFRGAEIRGVVILGLTGGCGAAEIWSRDDRDELSISSAYYQGLQTLEFISRYVRFPKGAGLPGSVWRSGLPRIATELASSAQFMRCCVGDAADLATGLGLPVGESAGHSDSVLLLLSDRRIPVATLLEIWHPAAARNAHPRSPNEQKASQLTPADVLAQSETVVCNRSTSIDEEPDPGSDDSPDPWTFEMVQRCWNSGQPMLCTERTSVCDGSDQLRSGPELHAVLCLPIYRAREPAAVVVMGF